MDGRIKERVRWGDVGSREKGTCVVGGLTEYLSTTRTCWGTEEVRMARGGREMSKYRDERLSVVGNEKGNEGARAGVESAWERGG